MHCGKKLSEKIPTQAGACPCIRGEHTSQYGLVISLVPVIANGFDDLQQRVEAQSKQAAAHQERLKVCISSMPSLP